MKQKTLFDIGPEPTLAPTPKTGARYYLYFEDDGKRYALVASHDNGGPEFERVTELARQPKLYDSWFGANKAKYYQERTRDTRFLQIAAWNAEQIALNKRNKG